VLFSARVPYASLAHTLAYHCVIGSNPAHDHGALGGQHSPSHVGTNRPSVEQGKH
jgi:hypothetical protein